MRFNIFLQIFMARLLHGKPARKYSKQNTVVKTLRNKHNESQAGSKSNKTVFIHVKFLRKRIHPPSLDCGV